MSETTVKTSFFAILAAVAVLGALPAAAQQAGVGPNAHTRYATDAYPGFANDDSAVRPEKKGPRWFAFITGPKMDNAKDQFAWARACEADGSWGKARRAYDALVRNWPTAPEAPQAQESVGRILLEKEDDPIEAFDEYRYLLDFYSLQCDYDAVAKRLYDIVREMRARGKRIAFFRFSNTVDVRRAYEALVLRAPGAPFIPEAMLTVADLRVEEGKPEEAVKIYENLRNHHPGSPEALSSWHSEGTVRMNLIKWHGYNRDRVADTAAFLKLGLRAGVPDAARADFETWLSEIATLQEEEAWRATSFYDSPMRTKRSAISAYGEFLRDYPLSPHADEARARLEKLEGEVSK